MLAIILILACYFVLVVVPAFAVGVLKDGSPLKREWWT